MFDAVLFDLDGTLINSSADLCATSMHSCTVWIGLIARLRGGAPHWRRVGSLLSSMPERGHRSAEDCDVFLAYYQEGLLEMTWLHEPLADWQRTLRHPTALVTNKPRRFDCPLSLGLDYS